MPNERRGFHLAGDLMWVHGEHSGRGDKHRSRGGRTLAYTSLPSAAFMLAFAAAEKSVKDASRNQGLFALDKDGEPTNKPLGIGSVGLVNRWEPYIRLVARTRVAPTGKGGVARWELLNGDDLQRYLDDAVRMRNRLAHVGSVKGMKNQKVKSPYFTREKDGKVSKPSITLPLAEGFLQAAQDIAYLLATPEEQAEWDWVIPNRTRVGRPKVLDSDPRLPSIC